MDLTKLSGGKRSSATLTAAKQSQIRKGARRWMLLSLRSVFNKKGDSHMRVAANHSGVQASALRRSVSASTAAASVNAAAAAPTGRESSPDLGMVLSITRALMSMLTSIRPSSPKASMR